MPNSTPTQEAADRIAEGLPGLKLAASAVGLANHRAILSDHLQRVRDSHKMQARALGMEDLATDAETDDMGDIIICGDGCFTTQQATPDPVPVTSPPPPAQPAPSPVTVPGGEQVQAQAKADTPRWKKAATVAAIVAGMGGSGAIGGYLASQADKPAAVSQPAASPTPQGYGVVVEKATAKSATVKP